MKQILITVFISLSISGYSQTWDDLFYVDVDLNSPKTIEFMDEVEQKIQDGLPSYIEERKVLHPDMSLYWTSSDFKRFKQIGKIDTETFRVYFKLGIDCKSVFILSCSRNYAISDNKSEDQPRVQPYYIVNLKHYDDVLKTSEYKRLLQIIAEAVSRRLLDGDDESGQVNTLGSTLRISFKEHSAFKNINYEGILSSGSVLFYDIPKSSKEPVSYSEVDTYHDYDVHCLDTAGQEFTIPLSRAYAGLSLFTESHHKIENLKFLNMESSMTIELETKYIGIVLEAPEVQSLNKFHCKEGYEKTKTIWCVEKELQQIDELNNSFFFKGIDYLFKPVSSIESKNWKDENLFWSKSLSACTALVCRFLWRGFTVRLQASSA